jgi:hypothetical protein
MTGAAPSVEDRLRELEEKVAALERIVALLVEEDEQPDPLEAGHASFKGRIQSRARNVGSAGTR